MRFILCSATISLALSTGGAAQACSDLPNICEQQRLHWEQMNDIGAAREAINREEMERNVTLPLQPSAPPYDPMQERLNQAVGILQLVTLSAEKVDQLTKDPRFQRYQNGGWDFFQDKNNAAPGEYCAAFFWKKDGFVRVSGPGGDYQGALLTFWGKDIPRPEKVQKIKATLSQSSGPPQTVQVFNYTQPGEPYGAISFTVPTIEMALDAMKDVESFDVSIKGKSVAKVEWHSGLAARNQLRECVNARTKK
ncbi:hypothetical protein IQ244_03375 [Nostoc sp. LEGE 06077]|nr:hypothetical protein [Nostoc sp. LEGE 06077]